MGEQATRPEWLSQLVLEDGQVLVLIADNERHAEDLEAIAELLPEQLHGRVIFVGEGYAAQVIDRDRADLLAEVQRLRALEAEVNRPHVLDVGPSGWSIEHPYACRAGGRSLHDCELHQAALREGFDRAGQPGYEPWPALGRWRVDLVDGELQVQELGTAPACRVCGCTDDLACDGGCHWVEEDLCSTCSRPEVIR